MRRLLALSLLLVLSLPVALVAEGDTPRRAFRTILRDPQVVPALRHDESPSIRSVAKGLLPGATRPAQKMALLQDPPLANFNGIKNELGFYPPDTNGDVGETQYVQMVNSLWAVFSKDGQRLYGPAQISSLWDGFGGTCEENDHGDPIVQYDTLSNRWVISQFSLPSYPDPPFYECIAVSTTEDALGSYNRYEFLMSNQNLPDYPHFGVWPDGYYMSVNLFRAPSFDASGQGIVAFDRAAMLNGEPAEMIKFSNPDFFGALPSDFIGRSLPPPPGAPNYIVVVQETRAGGPADQLVLYEFHTDWTDPNASEITGPALVKSGKVNSVLCSGFPGCIPQKGTKNTLDAIAGFPGGGVMLMYPLSYRNFGSHESLVLNHTVNVGNNRAGIRWYELREPGANVSLHQAGTHTKSAKHRWMGSISMDGMGNIGLGYSVTSKRMYPSIAYTGRLVSDALGTMTQGETFLHRGGGSQTGATRWGDYSSMSIDPVDDCTFWYTTEYYSRTSRTNWKTRIGSFRLPGCGESGSTPTPTPSP